MAFRCVDAIGSLPPSPDPRPIPGRERLKPDAEKLYWNVTEPRKRFIACGRHDRPPPSESSAARGVRGGWVDTRSTQVGMTATAQRNAW